MHIRPPEMTTARRLALRAARNAAQSPRPMPNLRLAAIEHAVGQVFGAGGSDLLCHGRGTARAARARQVAMYLAHVVCGMSLTAVGHLFGRDRTTVAHACGVIEDRRDDPAFDRALELLELVIPRLSTPRTLEALTRF